MAEKKNTQMIVKLTSFQDAVKRISDMTRAHEVKSDDHFLASPTLRDLPPQFLNYFAAECYWTLYLQYNWFYTYIGSILRDKSF